MADKNDSGDPFESELRLAQVPVLGFLMRLTGNRADSYDLLQLTNITAWEKQESYTAESNMSAWMCTIARNHYRNHINQASRKPTVPLLDSDVEKMVETRHQEREMEESRKRRLLHLCIEDLPDRQRSFVEAFYVDEKSLEDVALENGVKVNAVAQLLYRARQNLIRCVHRKSHVELETDSFSDLP